jgi:hypothetical protein
MSESENLLVAYCASSEFQDLLSGALLWGDLVPPLPPSLPPRDFSALAGRCNRLGTAFASLNKPKTTLSATGVTGPDPSVPGWHPQPEDDAQSEMGMYMCPGCDGVFQCYCHEDNWDAHSYGMESTGCCSGCARNPCECCDGCYPGCFGCQPDFNPADPWGDGAPEEHRGWLPGDWSDDE